jgi:ABC-type glycerol-3-phosphate transport system permease component
MITKTRGVPESPTRALQISRNQRRQLLSQVIVVGTLMVFLVLTLIPIVLMVFLSLKDNGQIFGRFWSLPNPVRWQNYLTGFEAMAGYIKNSLLYSIASVVGVSFLASLSGYVFARHRFPFKEALYLAILALLMIPAILTLIPQFVLVKQLGLLNTPWALILPWTAGGQVLGILLCRTFFATLPQELFDAGKIDGASEFQLYYKIAVPLSWPILVTLAIMHLVGTYNDFIWPLLTISSTQLQVVSVGLTEFTSQAGVTDWGPRMAAYTLATLPLVILFMFGMRYYIQGITSGAVKA